MKHLILGLIVIISYVLQLTLIPEFSVFGVQANLLLVVTLSIAFLFGTVDGAIAGLIIGLLIDLYQGRSIGICAITFFYLGIFVGSFNKKFFKDNYLIVLIIMICSTIIYETILYSFSILMYSQHFMFLYFMKNLFIAVVCNLIISIIVYPVLLKLNLGVEVHRNIFR